MAAYLVTGGAGFLGINLCRSLLARGNILHQRDRDASSAGARARARSTAVEPDRHDDEVSVRSNGEISRAHANGELQELPIWRLATQAHRREAPEKLRNIAAQQLVQNRRLALIVREAAQADCELVAAGSAGRPGRDLSAGILASSR